MAVSIKRPLDYTETIVEIPSNYKRIRLQANIYQAVNSSSIESIVNSLKACTNSREYLDVLTQISEELKDVDNIKDILDMTRKLSEYFRKENDNSIKVRILALFGDFAKLKIDAANSISLVDEIIFLLKNVTNPQVISQGLTSLYKIGKTHNHQLPSTHITKIVYLAQNQLKSTSHNTQKCALILLAAFASITEAKKGIIDMIGFYSESQDSRVRANAFRSLLTLSERGVELPASLYNQSVTSLHDDYECVRKEALQLVFKLGVSHPDNLITVDEDKSTVRLIDAAFGKVCAALCDVSMQIRTQAAQLLGDMNQVSPEFLHQTLDKKLMSNLRRKKSLHERNTQHFTSGEWSTGKKWADDAPKEHLEAASVSLIDSGACGALVHGLEDEFLEVRTASVDSMCRLALSNVDFSIMCLDFLVDMFNDEIEAVRLKAIFSLTAISCHIILREDQLEIMLSSLEDYSVDVREGLHLMLGACKVSTQSCLQMVVQKVLDVLSKYPQDKMSAYGCMKKIGQKHPELCMALTSHLLRDHPFFDSSERDVEDPSYTCILIMLFNAAEHYTPIISLFPDVTLKHFGYFRDTMPNLVPHLPIEDASSNNLINLTGSTGSQQALHTILNNIHSSFSASKTRSALLKAAQQNLHRLAEIDPEMFGTANFLVTFLSTELQIEQLHTFTNSQRSRSPLKDSLLQLIRSCLKLQNLFSGLTEYDMLLVKQICLRASALQLVLVVKDRSQSALGPCQLLLHIASDINTFLNQKNIKIQPDEFTTTLLNQLAGLTDPKPGRVCREILPIVQSARPVETPPVNVNIKMCVARIIDPSPTYLQENALKVTAGLIAALPFYAEIDNLLESQKRDIRLRMKYPDQNVHIVLPKISDFKNVTTEHGEEENNWRLRTTILLSHSVWTEASSVEITLCLSVRPGTELELCKPAKILFAPKPVRRGI